MVVVMVVGDCLYIAVGVVVVMVVVVGPGNLAAASLVVVETWVWSRQAATTGNCCNIHRELVVRWQQAMTTGNG